MVVKYVTVYYDPYEKTYGDGFYAYTKFSKGFESILTGFKIVDSCWQQVTGDPITGFDGNERNAFLELLNDSEFQSKNILDIFGYLI